MITVVTVIALAAPGTELTALFNRSDSLYTSGRLEVVGCEMTVTYSAPYDYSRTCRREATETQHVPLSRVTRIRESERGIDIDAPIRITKELGKKPACAPDVVRSDMSISETTLYSESGNKARILELIGQLATTCGAKPEVVPATQKNSSQEEKR